MTKNFKHLTKKNTKNKKKNDLSFGFKSKKKLLLDSYDLFEKPGIYSKFKNLNNISSFESFMKTTKSYWTSNNNMNKISFTIVRSPIGLRRDDANNSKNNLFIKNSQKNLKVPLRFNYYRPDYISHIFYSYVKKKSLSNFPLYKNEESDSEIK